MLYQNFAAAIPAPQEGALTSEIVSRNGISYFAYHVVLCLVVWKFSELHVILVRISREICAQFTLSSHSQASREEVGLDPCK